MSPRFTAWLIRGLLEVARRLMPPQRARWWLAMRAEIDYLPHGAAARWAAGCVGAALKERFAAMLTGDLRVSRFVMLIEAIGCFGFLTIGWYQVTFGAYGAIHFTADVITRYFIPYAGGAYHVSMIFAGVIVGLVGPVGLYFGARYALTGRALSSRAVAIACATLLLAYTVVGGIAGMLFGPPEFRPDFDMAILATVLPLACIAHLHWLSKSSRPAVETA